MDQLANTIIDALGGTTKTAELCDVKPPSVSEWRHRGIPKAQLRFLKAVRPEVFRGSHGFESDNKTLHKK